MNDCEDYFIGLPLYSEVSFENVRYIRLTNEIATTRVASGEFYSLVVSNVVYGTS